MSFGGYIKSLGKGSLGAGVGFVTGGPVGAAVGLGTSVAGSIQGKQTAGNAKRRDTQMTDAFSSFLFAVQQRVLAGESDPDTLDGFAAEIQSRYEAAFSSLVRPESRSNQAFTDLYPRVVSQVEEALVMAVSQDEVVQESFDDQ